MAVSSKEKKELRVIRKMLYYYQNDYERNNVNWDEGFKAFIAKRIESLKKDELVILKKIGYA